VGNLGLSDTNLFAARAQAWLTARTVQNNMYDVRLLFRWPLLPNNLVGNSRQTYRLLTGGILTNLYTTIGSLTNYTPLWFFQPQTYSAIPTNQL
jgi:hypothetical protein